jgi:hypothetical protein
MVVMFFMEWSTGFCVDYERKKQCVIQHKTQLMNDAKKEKHPKNQRKPRFWYNPGISTTRDRPENTT